jgi:hypothetical protein
MLFATIITTHHTPQRHIHSPHRIMPIAENSTTAPRTVQNNVLMSFKLKCCGTWNARMFSGSSNENNLFLMDQDNIPVVHSYIKATDNGIKNSVKIYNITACVVLLYAMWLKNIENMLLQKANRPNQNFILYKKMINDLSKTHETFHYN